MEDKKLIFESEINEIFVLVNEDISSFNNAWGSIKDKISNSLKNVTTKEEAVDYLKQIYEKTKALPDIIKNKITKYVIAILISTFGTMAIVDAIPSEMRTVKDKIVNVDGSGHEEMFSNIQKGMPPTHSSEDVKNFIKGEEGFSLKAYDIGDGMITIGWGHAERVGHSKFRIGDRITPQKAEELFQKDIQTSERYLNQILKKWKREGVKVKVDQGMYDAMVSMIFNMGIGNFLKSDFLKLVKQNKLEDAKERILTTAVTYKGHKKRRAAESAMFGRGMTQQKAKDSLRRIVRKVVQENLNVFENDIPGLKYDTILIYLKDTLKNNRLEITTKNEEIYWNVRSSFWGMKDIYFPLHYFLQGDVRGDNHYWLMFETWSDNENLFLDSAEWLSKITGLPIEFGN